MMSLTEQGMFLLSEQPMRCTRTPVCPLVRNLTDRRLKKERPSRLRAIFPLIALVRIILEVAGLQMTSQPRARQSINQNQIDIFADGAVPTQLRRNENI